MTATPIPRTLALTLYGDLDISSITELPPGRQMVQTEIIDPQNLTPTIDDIEVEIAAGYQGFVIYPLIHESDNLDAKAATVEMKRLQKEVFPQFKLALIHGQIKPQEREQIMADFKNKKYDILVATSVIEVGIDIPNASFIIIENPERFGLAQLHQLRGRVGRGERPAKCYLIPSTPESITRLKALQKYHDGFRLAEIDLQYRGMGELVGLMQSGRLEMKIANPHDLDLIKKAREHAHTLLEEDSSLKSWPGLEEWFRQKTSKVNTTEHGE